MTDPADAVGRRKTRHQTASALGRRNCNQPAPRVKRYGDGRDERIGSAVKAVPAKTRAGIIRKEAQCASMRLPLGCRISSSRLVNQLLSMSKGLPPRMREKAMVLISSP